MRKTSIAGALAVLASLMIVVPALAGHGQQTLPNTTSKFEIDNDANLKVDDTGNIDWASVTEIRKSDSPSGANDESFVQGTKEDTPVPVIETGSIPPNKSDLLTFGAYLETAPTGEKYLNIFWHRVQEPQGTTNMDFEFNKSSTKSANTVTPVRTEGDILIQYDLPSGGSTAELFLSRWITSATPGATNSDCEANGGKLPCWEDRVDLTAAGDAVGTINSTQIVDDPNTAVDETDGLGTISPRTFGEAQIDFSAFAGGDDCVGFGSAYLKSRSSDSFTSALKDFIPPTALNFNECGALKITKTAKHANDSNGTIEQAGVDFIIDPAAEGEANIPVETGADGTVCVSGLALGTYEVTETPVPEGYVAQGDGSETVVVDQVGSCTAGFELVPFVNVPLTDFTVSVNSQVAGGTDTAVTCVDAATPTPNTVGTLDTADATGDGSVTVEDLEPGIYTCTINIDP
jgi:Prealbumin-like fold domain